MPSLSSDRVLIIDDDVALLSAVPTLFNLRLPHVAVDTLASVKPVLRQITYFDYDAIITDMKMPGDGRLDVVA
jgi:DNA-binding NtrC family response regulator